MYSNEEKEMFEQLKSNRVFPGGDLLIELKFQAKLTQAINRLAGAIQNAKGLNIVNDKYEKVLNLFKNEINKFDLKE